MFSYSCRNFWVGCLNHERSYSTYKARNITEDFPANRIWAEKPYIAYEAGSVLKRLLTVRKKIDDSGCHALSQPHLELLCFF
jgi:hypothetical protein